MAAPIAVPSTTSVRHRARVVAAVFILTFLASRVLVLLIMTRRMPDLFLHLGGTHVHHLNYGIFLLSIVGGIALFTSLRGRALTAALVAYGIGLALTFDEFGMWLHLGGSYWQRASYDAIIVIAALLVLIAYAPSPARFRTTHWAVTSAIAVGLIALGVLLVGRANRFDASLGPWLEQVEAASPP